MAETILNVILIIVGVIAGIYILYFIGYMIIVGIAFKWVNKQEKEIKNMSATYKGESFIDRSRKAQQEQEEARRRKYNL